MRTTLLLAILAVFFPALLNAQDDCAKRSFIANSSFNSSGFTVLTYVDDLLDSLHWDFGDGQSYFQNSNVGAGAANHTYAAPGIYNVTLERWGVKDFPQNTTPLHCVFTLENVVYDVATDSICGGDFLTFINGNTVTFSNRSVIQAPAFNSHSTEPLWDFGNGTNGGFINRIYDVTYAPGTYTACLYYGGFSFNNGGYLFDCSTCNTFTIGGASGVEEQALASIKLFPDPASEYVELTSDQPINATDVDLFDATGRVRSAQRDAFGNRIRFDIGSLAQGTYYMRVRTGGSMRTLPFVKL